MKLKTSPTRERIKEVTIALLNEGGVGNVTMREVSKAMNMSPGNLTYHYPKWDYLIDDIFTDFQTAMEELYVHFPQDISNVPEYIGLIYELQMEFAFIFSDFYLFFQKYPRYNSIKEQFFESRMKVMFEALQRLVQKGYLYPNCQTHNYRLLVKNTWLILSGWYGFSRMFEGTSDAYTREEFFLSIWNLYVHHLTPRGMAIVRRSYLKLT